MTAERMLMRFIWKLETAVKNAARRVRPFCWSSLPGGKDGKVWKWSGRPTSFTAFQSGSQQGCHMGSIDRKSTRLNSSHLVISYAVFCLKKKKKNLATHVGHALHWT